MTDNQRRLRLGYACAWWHPREQTWSYTATRLRRALDECAAVVDLEAQRSLAGKAALATLYKLRPGTPWKYSPLERSLIDRAVRRGAARLHPDAVLGIAEADTHVDDVPSFLYQDMNAASALASEAATGLAYVNLIPASRRVVESLAREQADRCRRATGVFAMSEWFARILVDGLGVKAERVAVVHAGMNNPPVTYRDPSHPPEGRVLFVGTDFVRKGGDLVLEACRRLHARGHRDVRLTIVGPERWPGAGPIPEFVDFRGLLPPSEVSALFCHHDVFAMPSRFEAFGIAFAEALVGGLPCVARRAFAMPEIVEDGRTGTLVDSEDPDEVAEALLRLMNDATVFDAVAAARPALLTRFDWRGSAAAIVNRISAEAGRGS